MLGESLILLSEHVKHSLDIVQPVQEDLDVILQLFRVRLLSSLGDDAVGRNNQSNKISITSYDLKFDLCIIM